MAKTNSAARKLYLGARVFNLVSTNVDADHKSKDENGRIAVPAKMYTTKAITVNELKFQALPGGIDAIIVNGSESGLKIPLNYEFVSDSHQYRPDRYGEHNPAYFADYKAIMDVANTANEAELIRLQIIREDLDKQIQTLKDVIVANKDAEKVYVEEC